MRRWIPKSSHRLETEKCDQSHFGQPIAGPGRTTKGSAVRAGLAETSRDLLDGRETGVFRCSCGFVFVFFFSP